MAKLTFWLYLTLSLCLSHLKVLCEMSVKNSVGRWVVVSGGNRGGASNRWRPFLFFFLFCCFVRFVCHLLRKSQKCKLKVERSAMFAPEIGKEGVSIISLGWVIPQEV